MLPVTHLMASWVVAAKATRNLRDCRLVALGGILPDLDGLPGLVDRAEEEEGTFLFSNMECGGIDPALACQPPAKAASRPPHSIK